MEETGGLFGSIIGWFRQPFKGSGQTAFQWTLFVGLIIVVAFLWQLVLLEVGRD